MLQDFTEQFTYVGLFLVLFAGCIGIPIPEEAGIITGGVLAHEEVVRWWIGLPLCLSGALELGKHAVLRVIERAGWNLRDVDFLATTTCTGHMCPSLDAHLINELGLKSSVQRVHVGDTGCASAMVALQQACNHVRAYPDHRAVVVAVEICSAAYFFHDRLKSAVAHAIFADGAGAVALATNGPGPAIIQHQTIFRSEHLSAMGFEYPGGRPRVVLSKEVRHIGATMVKGMADALMAAQGLKKRDVQHFILHSAGRRVIEQAAELMELDANQAAHSRHVLRHYGNMSSATVLFSSTSSCGLASLRRTTGTDDRAWPRLRSRRRAAEVVTTDLWTRRSGGAA